MEFTLGNIYHIYNRGNNKQNIFYEERNYIYFLQKVRKHIYPCCDLLAYVLMPNHFHLLVRANEQTITPTSEHSIAKNTLSEGIRVLLSGYTKGINKQQGSTGHLLSQNTKSKCVFDMDSSSPKHAVTCFHYIHLNPIRAGLVSKNEDWHYSSYRDYNGLRNGTLCNKELAISLLQLDSDSLKVGRIFDDESLKNIW